MLSLVLTGQVHQTSWINQLTHHQLPRSHGLPGLLYYPSRLRTQMKVLMFSWLEVLWCPLYPQSVSLTCYHCRYSWSDLDCRQAPYAACRCYWQTTHWPQGSCCSCSAWKASSCSQWRAIPLWQIWLHRGRGTNTSDPSLVQSSVPWTQCQCQGP